MKQICCIFTIFFFCLLLPYCEVTITFPATGETSLYADSPGGRLKRTDGSLLLGLRTIEESLGFGRNAALSPASIYICLLLLYFGARGDTKAELANIVGDVSNSNAFNELSQLRDLHTAAATFVHANTTLKYTYGSAVQQSVYSVDFSDGLSSRDIINRWVSHKTAETIPSLLEEPLDASTRAVAISALYFNASWMYPFPPTATRSGRFDVSPDQFFDVPLMTVEATLPIYKSPSFNAVGLPYLDNGFTFYLVIPNALGVRALKNVIRHLSPEAINQLVQDSVDEPAIVTLPKIKLDYRIRLKPGLQRLGVNKMFDRTNADFGDMIAEETNPKLFVSDVYHSVHMDVDEGGTRASAATATILTKSSRWIFRANRPFIFFIRHVSGHVLFVGTVVNPAS